MYNRGNSRGGRGGGRGGRGGMRGGGYGAGEATPHTYSVNIDPDVGAFDETQSCTWGHGSFVTGLPNLNIIPALRVDGVVQGSANCIRNRSVALLLSGLDPVSTSPIRSKYIY